MQRYRLIIEYEGTNFSGWQAQENVPTIQARIEAAILQFSGQEVKLHVAGRTDAGVHARGQVAHVDMEPFSKPMDGFEIAKAINAHLRPDPIAVLIAEPVSEEFHARFAAKNKLYQYRIINRGALLGLEQGKAWHVKKPLNVTAMHEAAQHLLGHHDFTTFRDSQCQANTPMRTLDRCDVSEQSYDVAGGREIFIEVEGQSFLHHMVRNIAGTLVLVGEGKWQPDDVKAALEECDRTKGGPTAPAEGLYLMRIDYPDT